MKKRNMKHLLSIGLAIVLAVSLCLGTLAAENKRMLSRTVEQLDGESYIVVTVYDTSTARSGKSGAKDYDYYEDDGKWSWTLTVYGTFEKTGNTYRCIDDSVTYDTSSRWSCDSATSWHGMTAANATGTFSTTGKTMTKNLTLSCDSDGNLS